MYPRTDVHLYKTYVSDVIFNATGVY